MAKTRKRRRPKTKEDFQKRHAQRRFLMRFERELTEKLYREWQEKIQRGDCIHVEQQSVRVSVKKIEHEGEWYYVVYDKSRKTIVTVLTDEMARKNNYV